MWARSREPDRRQQVVRALDRLRLETPHARQTEEPRADVFLLVLLEERHEVLERGEPRKHADELERAPDAETSDAVGRGAPVTSRSRNSDAAAVGRQEPGDAIEQRRLARAVRTDQAHQLARLHGEVDGVDGRHAEESLGEAADLEERHGYRSFRNSWSRH